MSKRVFITAAEVSGDRNAASVVRALKSLDPTIIVEALGGPALAEAGAILRKETVKNAAMTFHALKRVFEFSKLLKETKRYYRDSKPDLHICVDSSGVNLHFAQAAKEAGIPVLYFVAPQLWASREKRVKKLRKYVDKLACIFPFEEPYFRKHGVDAVFVGHPLFDELPQDRYSRVPKAEERFPNRPPVIGIVPGSRKAEVKSNFVHLLDVADRILAKYPNATFLIPTTPAVDEMVREALVPRTTGILPVASYEPSHGQDARGTFGSFNVGLNSFDEFVPRCDLVLTKSGTSTVHVAAWGTPMIVVYRLSLLLWHGLGKWMVTTKKIAMVNILAGQIDLVPEFVPWNGSNEPVANAAIDLLDHPEKLEAQRIKLRDLIRPLDRPGASMNVAKLAMEMMEGRESSGH